jgi:hypothetical protein
LRAEQRGTHCFDSLLVCFAVRSEPCEVVIKGSVDDTVGHTRAAAQAVEILDIATMHFGPDRGERTRTILRSRQSEYLMAAIDEFLGNGGTQKACRTGNKNTHDELAFT